MLPTVQENIKKTGKVLVELEFQIYVKIVVGGTTW